jgi:hypothetical protein
MLLLPRLDLLDLTFVWIAILSSNVRSEHCIGDVLTVCIVLMLANSSPLILTLLFASLRSALIYYSREVLLLLLRCIAITLFSLRRHRACLLQPLLICTCSTFVTFTLVIFTSVTTSSV